MNYERLHAEQMVRAQTMKLSEFLELVALLDLQLYVDGDTPGKRGRLQILREHIERLKEQGQ